MNDRSVIVLRGGTVVDGTGGDPIVADVAIAGGRIRAIGTGLAGDRSIDVGGAIVAPGFVDLHTHYDPQVLWDPWLTPSCWHGVTSVVAGNCGYSIAPATAAGRGTILRTLEKVEDMLLATLEAGVDWAFESYGEYLAAIEAKGTILNFGGYVGHFPVRVAVLGDEAYTREATAAEIDKMRGLVAESIRHGALGFSSDRGGFHLGDGGRPVPSVTASQAELEALMRVTAEIGQGIVHVSTGEHFAWLYEFQRVLRRPITWSSLIAFPYGTASKLPYADKIATHLAGRAAGADVSPQVTCRPIAQSVPIIEPSALYGIPAFQAFVAEPRPTRDRLLRDESWRRQAWADFTSGRYIDPRWATVTITETATQPELLHRPLTEIAAARGCTPFDVLCDTGLSDGMTTRFTVVFGNDIEDGVRTLLTTPGCVLGSSDAGAHVGAICDAVMPTDFLSGWVRDRGVLDLPGGIRKLTGEPADLLQLDRGYLRPGAQADVVVLDWDALDPGPTRRVADMPAGGERLIADAPKGVELVLVNGTPILRSGALVEQDGGRRPGQVLRSRPAGVPVR
jgi:N-acyl-D-aspartate/D-glutamate deacylase